MALIATECKAGLLTPRRFGPIISSYATKHMTDFSQNSAGAIGTAYTVTTSAYCIADEEFPASTSTRYAPACYLPTFIADPVAGMTTEEFMAAMFD